MNVPSPLFSTEGWTGGFWPRDAHSSCFIHYRNAHLSPVPAFTSL